MLMFFLVIGVSVGMCFVLIPLFITEISPTELRGLLGKAFCQFLLNPLKFL
jgi:hypothetical protein